VYKKQGLAEKVFPGGSVSGGTSEKVSLLYSDRLGIVAHKKSTEPHSNQGTTQESY
jgi:hypothetical protein